MGVFGMLAVDTAIELGLYGGNPRGVWDKKAILQFGTKLSMVKKGCPKSTFLSLCEYGFIYGVAKGNYSDAKENKKITLDAMNIIKKFPHMGNNPKQLWDMVSGGKTQNSQMDVICTLFSYRLLNIDLSKDIGKSDTNRI